MKRISKVLISFAMVLSASSSYAQVTPSRGAVIKAAGHLTIVTDNMSIFAQQRNYPNTSNDLAEIMKYSMKVEEAARFDNTPEKAMNAYNGIVRTWFSVRQRVNTICRFYSLQDCYFIRNNVRMAINGLAKSFGQPVVVTCPVSESGVAACPVGANADDADINEISAFDSQHASWINASSGDGQDTTQPSIPTPSPSTGGWNP
jgi:hypothetical protein